MRYGLLGIALALLLLAGCDTLNIGIDPPYFPPPSPETTFWASNGWYAGETAKLTVTWLFGESPFTLSADMGGGTTENIPAGTPAVSPFSYSFTLVEGDYTYTVTVVDADGSFFTAQSSYSVGPPLNHPPSIDDVTFENWVLTVHVSDPDGDELTVSIGHASWLDPDESSKIAIDGVAIFHLQGYGTDTIFGGSGKMEITVDDGKGGTDTAEFNITIDPISIPDDALAAVPVMSSATTDDVVTIVVISGRFAHPFMYMNGVGLTVDSGAAYVDGTLNVGVPGGEQMDVDGVWTSVSPDSFLLPNDFIIMEQVVWGDRVRIDFNVTPIGGHETTTGGALFNFGLSFDQAGTYTLGFEEFHDVKRTYYSDSTSTEYYWDDISNDYPGVPNSIEVT